MSKDRFERIEGKAEPLPQGVREAVEHLNRFANLEIGELRAPAPAAAASSQRILCRHCSQPNEPQRETCWACFKKLAAEAAAAQKPPEPDFTIVLDGKTYKSSDKDLPEDIRELMRRIQAKGYSEDLLVEWRNWRVTRNEARLAAQHNREVKVFKGQRVSVIRIDDKVYTSDDPNLSADFKELFAYVEKNGVTPALMEHLRGQGDNAKFRPATTAHPSDGDVEFWKQAEAQMRSRAPASIGQSHDEWQLDAARQRHEQQRWRVIGQLAPIGIIAFAYVVAALFKGC